MTPVCPCFVSLSFYIGKASFILDLETLLSSFLMDFVTSFSEEDPCNEGYIQQTFIVSRSENEPYTELSSLQAFDSLQGFVMSRSEKDPLKESSFL